MPDPNPRKFFLCSGRVVPYAELHQHEGSHILGELRHLTDEGCRVSCLALYVTPTDCMQVPPVNPPIVAYVIGDARLIKCRYADCESRPQRWEIGKAGFLALMSRMGYPD